MYKLVSFCPFTLTLLDVPGSPGAVTVPSSGRAVVEFSPGAQLPALDIGPTAIPVTVAGAPIRVVGLPDTLDEGEVAIVPLAVAAALRALGDPRPYRIFSPELLRGLPPTQYAPGLVEHPDLLD